MTTSLRFVGRGAALAALVLFTPLTTLPASAQVASRRSLTLDGARAIATAAATEARRLGAGGAIALVDDGGNLIYLERLDDTFPAAATIAIEKARTAATFRKPTRDFEQADRVTFIEAAKTMAAFAKGQPLIETATFKVHASRRDAAGMAEVHARDTDVIYVLDGRATVITGGTVIDGKATAPDERRGRLIEGGTSRTLAKGDVLIVPEGVPHWFSEVKGPLLYYVVKVTLPAGATAGAVTAAATAAIGGAR